jgi:hypothetical protein
MRNIYDNALLAQSACNLSGIVKSLADDIDEIWKEARAKGEGTDYVNQHPVVRLYIEQMVHLNKSGFINEEGSPVPYHKAYETCQAEAEKAKAA